MDTVELIGLAVIGFFAGTLGGLLGIGGSLVMIPAMTELLGPDQHRYQAAAMIVNFFVVVPAVIRHRRARAIDPPTIRRLLPIAAVSVLVGVWLSERSFFAGGSEVYLRGLFGLFLLLVCLADLYRIVRPVEESVMEDASHRTLTAAGTMRLRTAMLIAVPTGLVAGLLGVGGGIMAVPLQRRFLHIPLQRAIANSAAIIVATSVIGATAKNWVYISDHGTALHPIALAIVLIPTAVVGGFIGSGLTHRLPLRIIKLTFLVAMAFAALRMTSGAIRSTSVATTSDTSVSSMDHWRDQQPHRTHERLTAASTFRLARTDTNTNAVCLNPIRQARSGPHQHRNGYGAVSRENSLLSLRIDGSRSRLGSSTGMHHRPGFPRSRPTVPRSRNRSCA